MEKLLKVGSSGREFFVYEKMATTIGVSSVNYISSNGVSVPKYEVSVKLVLEYDPDGLSVKIKKGK